MSSIDKFLETPPADLVKDLKALRDQRAAIERKEGMLEQTLHMIAEQGGEGAADEIAALTASAGVGSLREQILQIVAAGQAEGGIKVALVPKEVQNELADRGNHTAKLDNIRITMKRMSESDELERPLPQYAVLYALPGTAKEYPKELEKLAAMLEQGLSK
jgi:hypothetical protein